VGGEAQERCERGAREARARSLRGEEDSDVSYQLICQLRLILIQREQGVRGLSPPPNKTKQNKTKNKKEIIIF
jgi:hypothetical protein